jgi:membrane associated rhomboid family serine protease
MLPVRDDQPRFGTPYVTYFLIALNTLIYLFEAALTPESLKSLLFQLGMVPANITGYLSSGSQLGLAAVLLPAFTSMFLHGSWMHVIGNMWFLWIFGDNVEDVLGHAKYLVFYLLCGIAAGLTQTFFNVGSRLPMVGASGAIAGVMGAYLVKFPRSRIVTLVFVFFFITTIDVPATLMLLYWFFIQIFNGIGTIGYSHLSQGGTAWFAHVGGFIAGIVLVNLLGTRQKYMRRQDLNW